MDFFNDEIEHLRQKIYNLTDCLEHQRSILDLHQDFIPPEKNEKLTKQEEKNSAINQFDVRIFKENNKMLVDLIEIVTNLAVQVEYIGNIAKDCQKKLRP